MTRICTSLIIVAMAWMVTSCGDDGPQAFSAPAVDLTDLEGPVRGTIDLRIEEAEKENTPSAISRLGRVLHAHKYYSEAADLYQTALDRGGDEFTNLYLRGCALKIIEPEGAIAPFEAALTHRNDYAPLLLRLGLLLEQLGQTDQAEVHLVRSLEISDFGQAHLALGRIALLSGKKKPAIEYLKRACELLPADGAPFEALARAFRASNKQVSAKKASAVAAKQASKKSGFPDALMASVVSEGRSFAAYKQRSNIYLSAGHVDQALEWIDRALLVQPENVDGLFDKATILHVMKQHEKALALCEMILKVRPDMADASDLSAHCLKNLNRVAESIKVLTRAIENNPSDIHLKCSLAFFLTGKDTEQAKKLLAEAIKIDPVARQPRIQLASVLSSERNYDLAESQYNEALSYHPLDATLRLQYCTLLGQQSKWDAIRSEIKKIVARNPQHAAARELWEKLPRK